MYQKHKRKRGKPFRNKKLTRNRNKFICCLFFQNKRTLTQKFLHENNKQKDELQSVR